MMATLSRRGFIRITIMIVIFVVLIGAPRTRGQSISLTELQKKRLAKIVRSDPEAKGLFEKFKRLADQSLTASPDPIENIQSEGKLVNDPAKIRTSQSLQDMNKLEAMAYAFAVTDKTDYAASIRRFILAWAKANHSRGDPIDDTALEPLFIAYDISRHGFPAEDCDAADAYLREIVTKEHASAKADHDNHFNNWNSHRLKVIGLIAFILQDKPLIAQTVSQYKDLIDHNLHPDGSSYDFYERDALHYHIYDLTPLLTLAVAASNNNVDLYTYQSPGAGSLPKGIAFLLPFATGEKTHAEFVHSKVAFDRKRAESGQKAYQAGSPFEPATAVVALERAELYDASLLQCVTHLASPNARKYPTWQIVLNDARRRSS